MTLTETGPWSNSCALSYLMTGTRYPVSDNRRGGGGGGVLEHATARTTPEATSETTDDGSYAAVAKLLADEDVVDRGHGT